MLSRRFNSGIASRASKQWDEAEPTCTLFSASLQSRQCNTIQCTKVTNEATECTKTTLKNNKVSVCRTLKNANCCDRISSNCKLPNHAKVWQLSNHDVSYGEKTASESQFSEVNEECRIVDFQDGWDCLSALSTSPLSAWEERREKKRKKDRKKAQIIHAIPYILAAKPEIRSTHIQWQSWQKLRRYFSGDFVWHKTTVISYIVL